MDAIRVWQADAAGHDRIRIRMTAPKPVLTKADYARAALSLGVDVAAIKAVCEVEAPRGGFYADGSPTILFERHIFSRETEGRYDHVDPGLSAPTPGGYGPSSIQHARLAAAVKLNRDAALRSASWGKFQIMGFNHEAAGFKVLQAFINAMYVSESTQLDAFVNFIRSNPKMLEALQVKDWAGFARRYNGPNYEKNKYSQKLAAAYGKYS